MAKTNPIPDYSSPELALYWPGICEIRQITERISRDLLRVYALQYEMEQRIRANPESVPGPVIADVGQTMSALVRRFKEESAKVNDFLKTLSMAAGAMSVRVMLEGGKASGSLYGLFGIAMPKPEAKAQSISSSSPEYVELLTEFGVDPEVTAKGVLAVNWKRLCEFATERKEQGKPIPAAIKLDGTSLVCSYRARSDKATQPVRDEINAALRN